MAWVYLLECADRLYYVGSTRDLEKRMEQHSSAQIGFTSRRRPVKLMWAAELELQDAYAVERRIHGWSLAKKRALINGDVELLRQLSSRARGSITVSSRQDPS
ncbi:GIY-YIG nuclease family protein [Gordonia sp. KTR9]|uniref:GIY-YIG nuclease family protein n=1 Tax=Gordonia sp. KTR9 TaxID=337191 RepID=UPI00027DD948|nr:GIY-YIG nuclease family protein [Gordonia sp. KTR9]AFR47948.1 Putative endonuclease [Gordonia sp. KTR9]